MKLVDLNAALVKLVGLGAALIRGFTVAIR